MNEELVKCTGLCRSFEAVQALRGVDLSLTSGKIVGLLGPNGSGKTTLIKILNGLLQPTAGEARIAGLLPGVETKAITSYLPDRGYFPDWMRVGDMIDMFSDFYADFDRAKAEEMCRVLGLEAGSRIKTLSKGTREKMQLMLVMSRRARLYLLDEPIAGVDPAATGRPAYHPTVLLKLYIYGYLNRIPSSRRLEREAQRNLELIWLTGRLAPDFKTIADFRKDNGGAIDGGVQPLRCAVPDDEGLLACGRRNRRQQAQGGQQPRSQLHGRQGQGSPEAVGRERCALLGRAGSRRPRSQLAARGASPSPEGQAGEAARTDGEAGQHREAA